QAPLAPATKAIGHKLGQKLLVLVGVNLFHVGDHFFGVGAGYANEQFSFVGKVVVEAAFGQIGGFGDLFGSGILVPFLAKDVGSGIQNLGLAGGNTAVAAGLGIGISHHKLNSGSFSEDRKSTRLNSSHVKISYAV